MRYQIVDSHRNWTRKTKEKLIVFMQEVKQISYEEAIERADFCIWYEHEFAVKWFEVLAFDGTEIVGYLRCLRNVDSLIQWLIGDVHVKKHYRHQGIASRMYERAITTVKEYEAAEEIVTSVHCENTNSIALHRKMGFENTGKPCQFSNLFFPEKETEYKRKLYQYYPVFDEETAEKQLLPLWLDCGEKGEHSLEKKWFSVERLKAILHQVVEEENGTLETIWCGCRLVGFAYWSDDEEELEITYNIEDIEEKR